MTKKNEEGTSRRDFLKLASVSAPAAVAAVTLTGTEAEASTAQSADSGGIQDTPHTRAYYESTRF
ncbi:twin-arginine translocation signal domain-containing protein [Falsihalocynthiibacter sp. SS001]|uniref:twin-arginine translocation signal domain-containing protein n=1 Tax=Falsihalocynthiibacter sp. SS001 TaxID=3349698 RepID=UPI0036D24446